MRMSGTGSPLFGQHAFTATLFHSDLFGSVPILIKASGQLRLLVSCVCRGLEGGGRGGLQMSSLFGLRTEIIVTKSELYFNFLRQLLLQRVKFDWFEVFISTNIRN